MAVTFLVVLEAANIAQIKRWTYGPRARIRRKSSAVHCNAVRGTFRTKATTGIFNSRLVVTAGQVSFRRSANVGNREYKQ